MPRIVLATVNARFIHSALGLRCLYANMGELQGETVIREYTLESRPADMAEHLLREGPTIIGLGVYVWNVEPTTRLVALIKALRPELTVVLGGPEVSYEWQRQEIVALADYVISGPADLCFAQLCREILAGTRPAEKIILAAPPSLDALAPPYAFYTEEDIAHRVTYVEASRGCPFRCEFCLSALDKTAWTFDARRFLDQMQALYDRGARQFKFVDRTFNLDIKASAAILEFFLERWDARLFLHFEVVPDRLPAALQEVLGRFPAGSLQLEIGIQSFNPRVQGLLSRKQDNQQAARNLTWLRTHTRAHLHADLIAGLPGEDLASFAQGFDRLVALGPHEIQVVMLKRLRGAPMQRHGKAFRMRFDPQPPYAVLSTDCLDFFTVQRLGRFARYWDLIGNSGRFRSARPALLGAQPFARFMRLSDWLFATTGQTHRFSLKRLFELVYAGMTTQLGVESDRALLLLESDFGKTGTRERPAFLAGKRDAGASAAASLGGGPKARQRRHMR